MGPIRAQFWLPSAPLASWTRRNWRKTDRASGIGPIRRSKMAVRWQPQRLLASMGQPPSVGHTAMQQCLHIGVLLKTPRRGALTSLKEKLIKIGAKVVRHG